ncbi:MAG: hypothetical protein DCF31_17550 [Alphaproteobacteria bacterium]|nr:MAG: hypothetical protein DCF31_17550 [Alphaproteobacteria bacterium]
MCLCRLDRRSGGACGQPRPRGDSPPGGPSRRCGAARVGRDGAGGAMPRDFRRRARPAADYRHAGGGRRQRTGSTRRRRRRLRRLWG